MCLPKGGFGINQASHLRQGQGCHSKPLSQCESEAKVMKREGPEASGREGQSLLDVGKEPDFPHLEGDLPWGNCKPASY